MSKISLHAWLLAARPRTLIISTIPLFLAMCLALKDGMKINGLVLFYIWTTAVLIQIGTNIINDALDYTKGVDTEKRIGPVRVTNAGLLPFQIVYRVGIFCFLFSAIPILFIFPIGGWPILFFWLFSCLAGYCYTGGPYPLAYKGLGELFSFLFFGLGYTSVAYFLLVGQFNAYSLLSGLQIGFLIMNVAAVNNARDVETDRMGNKKTLAVRFGKIFINYQILSSVLSPYILGIFWLKSYPLACFLPFLSLPLGITICKGIWTHSYGRIYNKFFVQSAILVAFFGVLLGVGILL